MYLKKIILQGFKSFADKTVLEFEDGITAIVGPNGSGKSNILDALRWVMGEMSAKTLRGANMQQIIFSGTQTRKPLNFAEVSLVLDNSERTFPSDFDELVVTRRVFRSGESVYMINNANCRLRDVQELFMDTGIGRGGYSMIGQGTVGQILSSKAEDRREFFEGAAGVSKYKHRKDEAERKLSATGENLTRISDIVTELEGQVGPLEMQSRKARKYLDYYEEYKGLDVSMSLITINRNAELLKASEEARSLVSQEMDGLRSKESEITERIETLFARSKQMDEEKNEQTARLSANEQAKMSAQSDISIAKNDIENNKRMCDSIERELAAQKVRIEQMHQQILQKKEKIRESEEETARLTEGFAQVSDANNAVYAAVSDKKEELAQIRAELVSVREETSAKKAGIEGAEHIRQTYISRREEVERERTLSDADTKQLFENIRINEEKAAASREKAKTMRERVDKLRGDMEGKNSDLAAIIKEYSELTVNYNSMSSKKRILEGMENEYEGYARSVKLVLKAQELKRYSIYGALSGLVEVVGDYVTAIETVLAGALQNIVVENEDDAKAAIRYLKEQRGGRATFLPISSVKGRRLDNEHEVKGCAGVVGIAADLVKSDRRYRGIIENLLGRTVVCDNIDNAIALSKRFGYRFRVVTLAGEIFNAGGAISGGSVNKQSGFLSRANEIKTLTASIAAASKRLSQLGELRENAEGELKNLQTRLDSYLPLLQEYENNILIAENTAEHLKRSAQTSGETNKSLENEYKAIEEKLEASAADIARLIDEQRGCERRAAELAAKEEEAQAQLNELETEKERAANAVMEETVRLRDIAKDIENERAAIRTIEENIEAQNAESQFKNEEKQRIAAENEELNAKINEISERIEALAKNTLVINSLISETDAEKERIISEQKTIQESNKGITERLLLLQQEYSRAENKCEKLTTERDNTISRIWEDYELTPGSASEIAAEIEDEKAASKRLSELKGKIKALGSVNIDSIEEYKTVKERFEFLSAQKVDLEKSKDNLCKVIASLQELMEEQFNKQFKEINHSFEKVFSELFGGGIGRLYLSDPNNVLESGIEIEAQLPGKNLQNMSLYSGGERSMIATALLFAILAVKPTPFCVLDEIDAALDDVNVSRFATYLKHYLDETQFVIITHRRGTMEAANMLYGVTMQEKGVTKMLSLAIDEVSDDMLK